MERLVILSPTHPLQLVLGLIVWSVYFVTLYGGLSVSCAVAPPDPALGSLTWINGWLLLLVVSITAFLCHSSYSCWRARAGLTKDPQRRFIASVSAGVHLLAAVSVLAIGLPTLGLPPCV
jgi:hypothetical protein